MSMTPLYCSTCTQSGAFLGYLTTGITTGTPYHLKHIGIHTTGMATKRTNGIFPTTSLDDYAEAMHEIGLSGASQIEAPGIVNGFLKAPHINDVVEEFGVAVGFTDIRQVAFATDPNKAHGFGITGLGPYGCACSGCGHII